MTKKELQSYRMLARECEQLSDLLEETESYLYSPRSGQLSGMPQSPGFGKETEEKAIRGMELRERYQKQIAELLQRQLAIEEALEHLSPTEKILMRLRYIQGFRWEDICHEMHYSWKQVHRIHGGALEKMKDDTK